MVSLVLFGAVSGTLWGVIGYWFASDTNMKAVAWVGLAASPLIGVLISLLANLVRPVTLPGKLAASALGLYVAVFLFALAVSLAPTPAKPPAPPRPPAMSTVTAPDPCRDPAKAQTALCVPMELPAIAVAWQTATMFFILPLGWFFLPLSFLNHSWIWSRPRIGKPVLL